jgi:bifunctional DNase/RNase
VVQLELLGVRVELPSNTPVMLLQELEGRRRKLSIFIGGPEAAAIAFALDGVDPPRPLTHDLACTLVSELGSSLERVVITELRDTTFYADLHLADPGAGSGDDPAGGGADIPPLVVSARPSDAVALAVRVGYSESEEEEETPEEVVEEFREFIQNVSPDDFAS